MTTFAESDVEQAALDWLVALGWQKAYGPDIAPETDRAERSDFGQVALENRLRQALRKLNPDIPVAALETGVHRLISPDGPTLEARNRNFHLTLLNGATVDVRGPDGTVSGVPARVVDFEDSANNDWLAVNQFYVTENKNNRRADIVLFVNGLPLGIIELKNPTDPNARRLGRLAATSELRERTANPVLPERVPDRGRRTLRTGRSPSPRGKEWFKPWRTMDDDAPGAVKQPEMQVMLEGVCGHSKFLSLVRDFIVFDDDGSGKLIKKMAGYHQFHAVQAAVEETFRATALQREKSQEEDPGKKQGGDSGDRRIGVIWHNQGAGKSLTMAFFGRGAHPAPGHGKPHYRRPYRPERPGRPTFRHLLSVPQPPEAGTHPGREPR